MSVYPSVYLSRHGKTVSQVSRETGLSYQTVYNVMGKLQKPKTTHAAIKLSECLNIPLDDMVRWGVNKPKEFLPPVEKL